MIQHRRLARPPASPSNFTNHTGGGEADEELRSLRADE